MHIWIKNDWPAVQLSLRLCSPLRRSAVWHPSGIAVYLYRNTRARGILAPDKTFGLVGEPRNRL
jgi:hypothetical protein